MTELFENAVSFVDPVLDNETDISAYIDSVKAVIVKMQEMTDEDIDSTALDEAVRNSLKSDKVLLKNLYRKEADQVSLLSTLVIYEKCRREGYRNHSPKFMAKVKVIREKIEAYFNESTANICG